jgi:hypothetical protein
MNLSKFLQFFQTLAPILEPMLLNLEKTTILPELQKLADATSSPDIKQFLQYLITAVDGFAQNEIGKLGQ